MPIDLRQILSPRHTALLVIECQEGIVGEGSPLPELVGAVKESGMLETLSRLLACAREAGVTVYHCTVENRADGVGVPTNMPLAARTQKASEGGRPRMTPGSPEAAVVEALFPLPGDVVLARDHGLTAFHETGLDTVLRRARIETVVATGVSINIAVSGAAIEAVNRGYRVVVPTDCVAGVPTSYAREAVRYTLRNLAWLSTAPEIAEAWRRPWPPP